ncbi:hypothetical protein GCM10007962_10200 [Yeosuana aromativorans]|uniref:Uncharacterized protein n=1 Tax=Yeosuana aromativorans TaxID=288019 RepID=A0A8J3FGP3_9FLAO|nr:hypothetical protein [Yeosuana aromativorans]GGK17953.1 hypothetical protein GCM10007962_10200 [Yeosuana aromativorans]
MKKDKSEAKYQEWLSPDMIHKTSLNWLSEIEFIKDEQLFFNDLIKSYTLQLIDSKHFKKSKEIIDGLKAFEKETNDILKTVKMHERALEILVDGIDQIKEEEAYKRDHLSLIIDVSNFQKKHRTIKKEIFSLIKGIINQKKQKSLLQ